MTCKIIMDPRLSVLRIVEHQNKIFFELMKVIAGPGRGEVPAGISGRIVKNEPVQFSENCHIEDNVTQETKGRIYTQAFWTESFVGPGIRTFIFH